MPSQFPRTPRLLKGALVSFQSPFLGPAPNVIVFQYNPEQLTRSLTARAAPPDPKNVGAAREDAQGVLGPPVETIDIAVELDAADQLAEPDTHPVTVQNGLHPALAALELLLYPASSQVLLNQSLAQSGKAALKPDQTPLVLFVWGSSRVLPILLTRFTVTELAFDPILNPILAKVELGMRVQTYMELQPNTIGFNTYIATQTQKEVLARANVATAAEQVLGLLPF